MATSVARFVVALLFLPGLASLNWSEDLKDGQPVYACAGGSLLLPWNVSLTMEKEEIEDIQWVFQGRSQEMIAMYADGHFLVTPSFTNRVQHVTQGGLYFERVSTADSGNYTIEVSGHDASGLFYTLRRTVLVRVGDSLMTTDGNLHASTEMRAEWDNSDQQFHVVLSCGTFTYLTYPPFEIEWLLPTGDRQNSTRYEGGKFQLLLANPVAGGNYSCRIPSHSAAMACLPGDIPKPVMAGISVDSLESRLTVLEAQQTALQVENGRLKGDNANLQKEVGSLTAQLENYINETENRHVSFHASLSGSRSVNYGSPIILDVVTNNMGNAYNSTTGRFTSPLNGTYFFAATTTPYSSSSYRASAELVVDGTVSCRINPQNMNSEIGSCQTIVSLSAGQQVWLKSPGNSNYFYGSHTTSLTGFLLSSLQH